ncbi:MAG: metallophosphoesterase family protein [Eubacterium sp.]
MKKIISILTAVLMIFTINPISVFASEKAENALQFKDGKFKILILADIQDTNTPRQETVDLMNSAIDKTNPDFIVLTGDNIAGWWKGVDKAQTEAAVDIVAKAIDDRGIPFAFVFGNHDHEGLANEENGMTEEEAKEFILSCFQKYDTCLAVEGEEMTGVGNYNLLVKDSKGEKDIFNLWFMDSNPYTPEEEGGGYGYVHQDQIDWYKKTSDDLKNKNGGEVIPSLLFQHIVVPEVYDMFNEVDKGTPDSIKGYGIKSDKYYVTNDEYVYDGNLNEGPCPSNVNSGQFDSWLEQGDIIGAFFGHDHVNDFAGEYKGIKLVATPGVGFYSYGNYHGVRTVTLNEANLTDFESEVILFNDLVDYKVSNSYVANHGYYEYKNIFLPAVIGGTVGIVVLVGLIVFITRMVKRKKK